MMKLSKRTDATIKVCFIAPSAYPLLSGENPKSVLGPDVHQVLLANELIKYNFKVTFIAHNEGEAPIEHMNGVEVIKIHEDAYCLKILNIVSKVFRIWRAMRKANAHIYVYCGGTVGSFSPFCRLMKRKFILEISSDALVRGELVDRKIKGVKRFSTSAISSCYWLDIKLADAIIVQSEFQKKMLKKNFGKDSMAIKMPFPLSRQGMPGKAKPPMVLWVGAMAEVKQPELFLKLAEAIVEGGFQIIGGPSGNQELYNKIKERSKRIPNLDFVGVVPFREIDKYFSRAAILVNTSMFEGFPHAFIQAWMHYVPVVSLNADPDELICEKRLGFHSKTFNQLVEDVKTLLKDEKLREEIGRNARQHVESEHDITKNIKKYLEVFEYVKGGGLKNDYR